MPTPPATVNAPLVTEVASVTPDTFTYLISAVLLMNTLPAIPAPPRTCNAPVRYDVESDVVLTNRTFLDTHRPGSSVVPFLYSKVNAAHALLTLELPISNPAPSAASA